MVTQDIKITSLNVNGLNNPIKRKKIVLKMKREGGDVMFLQETHLSKEEHKKLERLANARVYSASFHSARRGVAILIKNSIPLHCEKTIVDKEGRYVLVKGRIDHAEITLLNIHRPPEQGTDLISKIIDMIILEAKGTLVMGGDLNLVMNTELDCQHNVKHKAEKTSQILKRAECEIGLIDVWRKLNPNKKDYTYYSTAHNKYSRLDYFFMFKTDIEKVSQCQIGTIEVSDHAIISMKVNLGIEKSSTIWRLNNSLLNDTNIKNKIREVIKQYIEINDNGEVSPIMVWEGAKAVIRGEIIMLASVKVKEKERGKKELLESLKRTQSEHKKNTNTHTLNEIRQIRKKIDQIELENIEKALTFTKQKYYDSGPKAKTLLGFQFKKKKFKCTKNKRQPFKNCI